LLSGVIPALLTPFSDDGEVDAHALRELTEYLVQKKVNGLYVCGSTGEGLLMTEAERCAVAGVVVQQVGGRVPVIVHVGALATRTSELLAGHAAETGADAVASVPPFYYPVGGREIAIHYRRIARAAGLPLYLYNIPDATHVSLGTELVRELAQEGTAAGIKYTSYNQLGFREIIEACDESFNVLAGPDEMLLPFLLMGAHGGIGTTYNLMPDLFLELYSAWNRGDVDRARSIQFKIDRVIPIIGKYGVIPAVKAAMRLHGVDCGRPRAVSYTHLTLPTNREV